MKIAIIGAGHMGSWLAREMAGNHEIAVFDRDREKAGALKGTALLSRLSEIESFRPDMLVNAVSLQNTIAVFEEVAPFLSGDAIICDVASIKTGIPDYYERGGFRFVSLHPMFGPTFADMYSLKEENVIIIRESDREGAQFFRDFFAVMGLNIFEYSYKEHDRMMAYSLTLPFVSSMVFAACVDAKAVPGTTFRKHMNIAKGLLSEDDNLLAEVLFSPHSLEEVEKVTSRLELLKHIIRQKDYEEAEEFFGRLRTNLL
jgi:prephenate dehydrogenase